MYKIFMLFKFYLSKIIRNIEIFFFDVLEENDEVYEVYNNLKLFLDPDNFYMLN